jgi:CubicO group peptidase (beta-lactamase class C family)
MPDFQNLDAFGLTRRSFTIGAGTLLTVSPRAGHAATPMIAWHNRTAANHRDEYGKAARGGMGLVSLSVYGEPGNPLFAAVVMPLPKGVTEEQLLGVTAADWPKRVDEMKLRGLTPAIITATGPQANPFIAAIFRTAPDGGPVDCAIGLDAKEFHKRNAEAIKTGASILSWLDCYGNAAETRFAAIWSPDTFHHHWCCGPPDEIGDALDQRIRALDPIGGRPAHIAVTPAGRNVALIVDRGGARVDWRTDLTSSQYQAEFNKQAGAGSVPIRVSAKGSGASARFAAIFAPSLPTEDRVFRASGPVTVPEIDAGIETYMKANGLHGYGFAVVKGTRLVYVKGYTWAGRDYPDVHPTTLFRQASVSKVFVALALYHIMQEQPSITLDTTMQSILRLTTPDGKPPSDARFGKITLRQLIESTSGLNNGLIWGSVDAAKAMKKPLPVDVADLARFAAAMPLAWEPGDPKHVTYSNAGYFMASRVVAKLRNKHSFIEAIAPTLGLLQMTRTRSSRSLFAAQAADEVRYHVEDMPTSASLRTDARPIVPHQYGGFDCEVHEGSGGLSAAAVDIARIAAMLAARDSNPVLRPANHDAWLENAALATQTLTGPENHGFHGFDGARKLGGKEGGFFGSKGGGLPGVGTALIFNTRGFSYVAMSNGHQRDGTTANWLNLTRPVAEKHDWGTTDLFPQFGMNSFAK